MHLKNYHCPKLIGKRQKKQCIRNIVNPDRQEIFQLKRAKKKFKRLLVHLKQNYSDDRNFPRRNNLPRCTVETTWPENQREAVNGSPRLMQLCNGQGVLTANTL